MSRLPWIAVAVAALALLGFLLWYTPERRAANAVSVAAAPSGPASVAAPVGAARSAPSAPASAPASTADVRPGVPADAGAPEPVGPFVVSLGNHTIYLKDTDPRGGRVAKFELQLVVGKDAAQKEVRLRREELVRMTYFLGSHRVAEGALGDEGRDRFARDLLERFRNVIRGGEVLEVRLAGYEVVPGPPRQAPLSTP